MMSFGGSIIPPRAHAAAGGTTRFDFETWLVQNYGIKAELLTEEERALAEEEYAEEYPPVGETEIRLKTYPFKKYLDSKR